MKHSHRLSITRRFLITALTAVTISLGSSPAFALLNDDNTLIEGAKLCTRYLPRHERQYGIPVHLLAAIASTESGRYHHALGLNLPWPWTINVEGKGYFFDTKEEAIAAVQKFQSRGFQSIDVGCMQVNLHHHPDAFANLDQAFDPAYNVAYAAQFLKQNFEEEGTWRGATADYHSHTPVYGAPYARMVFDAWGRIINKVADAKAGRPILNVRLASNEPRVRYHDKAGELAANAVIEKARATYHSPHMHEMSLTRDTSREKGVLVIRPSHDEEASSVVEAKAEFVSRTKTSQAAAQPAVAVASATSSGAQVVKVRDGHEVASRGQFSPQSHVIRLSGTQPTDGDKTAGKNIFVFDN